MTYQDALIAQLRAPGPGPGASEDTAIKLAFAIHAIANRRGTAFGTPIELDYDRDAVLAEGTAVMNAWLPYLERDALQLWAQCAEMLHLPIDAAPWLVSLDARRPQRRADRRAERLAAEPRDRELQAAIANGDEHAYSVYADWLLERGIARGEYIQLSLRDPALAKRFFTEHRDALLGRGHTDGLVWKHGFIDRVSVSNAYADITPILEHVLQHPAGQLVRAVELGLAADLDEAIRVLAREAPPYLRELRVGAFALHRYDISAYRIGDLSALWPALPYLQKLVI